MDAMLKIYKQPLEILIDIDMYNFFKMGIRGVIVQCVQQYSKAINKYLPDHNSKEPKT